MTWERNKFVFKLNVIKFMLLCHCITLWLPILKSLYEADDCRSKKGKGLPLWEWPWSRISLLFWLELVELKTIQMKKVEDCLNTKLQVNFTFSLISIMVVQHSYTIVLILILVSCLHFHHQICTNVQRWFYHISLKLSLTDLRSALDLCFSVCFEQS